ncbi:MAG TPA: hypothetical protein PLU53_06890 [Bacteroidia bacterium]|nr:hypothetical protein [Bacteroidia bacterium]
MKKAGWIYLLLAFGVPSPAFAQEVEQENKAGIVVGDVFLQTGFVSGGANQENLEDFRSLAPESDLLKSRTWDAAENFRNPARIKGIFSVQVGVRFNDKEKSKLKSNPLLRLGATYFAGTVFRAGFEQSDLKSSDTLISGQTGQQIFIDSVTQSDINMKYRTEQIRFDVSLLFQTNRQARWSLYGGFGITAGISINAQTMINLKEYGSTEIKYSDGSSSTHSYFSEKLNKETFRNKSNTAFSFYIPLGVDFRIGRRNEFWKKTHLFYEMRPGIELTNIPELGNFSNGSFQNGFGLKVSWN